MKINKQKYILQVFYIYFSKFYILNSIGNSLGCLSSYIPRTIQPYTIPHLTIITYKIPLKFSSMWGAGTSYPLLKLIWSYLWLQ